MINLRWKTTFEGDHVKMDAPDWLEMADEIERLRAALEQIVSECSRESTLKLQIAITCERIARAALSN
jgi:hypothetical protein